VSAPTLILLLRHGQSEWNALQRWQGTADPPLNELGRRQAHFVGSVLADQGHAFAGVWASDLARAADTAKIVAGVLDAGPVQVDPRLREANVGEWEGMTSGEIAEAWPGYLEAHRRPPGFEPFEAVVARVVPALHEIAGDAAEPQLARLVVAHSGVIRTLVRHLGHVDARVPNLGGVWLAITAGPAAAGTITLAGRFDPSGEAGYSLETPAETPVAER
jgi:broad specificity phosphatase PhoE